ncbi:MAG: flippase [Deferribacteres bacterium]|nr:flippase [candidate division KSB1 bacterium]MCB9504263.1 flippase [Deferribacteres bacterium]
MQKPVNATYRIISNSISILASDVMNRISMFLTYALVARFLGTLDFGQMALAFTYFNAFQMIAVAGLQSYITREVAKDHDKSQEFLLNASVVVVITSSIAILVLLLLVQILKYNVDTSVVIMMLSLGLIPFSLAAVCDALFQAREQMHYITMANFFVNVLRISGVLLLLWWKGSLQLLVGFFVLTFVFNFITKISILLRQIKHTGAKLDIKSCLIMAKSSTTFLGINGVNAAIGSFNIILLSKFTDEVQVGIFAAAHQLLTPISLLFESVVVGVYPAMCRGFESGLDTLKRMTRRAWEVLFAIVMPAAVTLFFLADSLFVFIYGNEDFTQSAFVLKIIVWNLVLRASSKVLGVALIASFREKKTLQILTIDLITMVILGFILIGKFGVLGSALTILAVRIVDFIQHYIPVSRMLQKIEMVKLLWKPASAVLLMALLFIFLKDINVIAAALTANIFYLAALTTILFLTIGNIDKIKTEYLSLKAH